MNGLQPRSYDARSATTQDDIQHQWRSQDRANEWVASSQYGLQESPRWQPPQSISQGDAPGQYVQDSNGTAKHDKASGRERSDGASKGKKSNSQAVRRRISRACDQCNQLRTKCDGEHPCAHCVEFGLSCEYVRKQKKRGKASKKDIEAEEATAAGEAEDEDHSARSDYYDGAVVTPEHAHQDGQRGMKRKRSDMDVSGQHQSPTGWSSVSSPNFNAHGHKSHAHHAQSVISNSISDASGTAGRYDRSVSNEQQAASSHVSNSRLPHVPSQEYSGVAGMSDYHPMDEYHRNALHPGTNISNQHTMHNGASVFSSSMPHEAPPGGYNRHAYGAPSTNEHPSVAGVPYQVSEPSIPGAFVGDHAHTTSPAWQPPAPPEVNMQNVQKISPPLTLRYPVLQPLVPFISPIMPLGLASDLLELYFSSTSSTFQHPQSPYVVGYVFRKRSFLRSRDTRVCSPALLASMLWVAAQTSESSFLSSSPSARGKVCQKLLELTISLLKPLVHTPAKGSEAYGAETLVNGLALGGLGVALPAQAHETDNTAPGASGAVDDVATYIHLATVVSASEYKGASVRWWNSAWSLARELKLGKELPNSPDTQNGGTGTHLQAFNGPEESRHSSTLRDVDEERKEERRRVWWLLYVMDRHLALCYNRPLYLLDAECEGLLQPVNEMTWQAGEYYNIDHRIETSDVRKAGPRFECTGHNMFGFFLPLMTILGGIVDMNHARNHPRFGLNFYNGDSWNAQVQEISRQLETYGRSLAEFEMRNLEPTQPVDGVVNGEVNHHFDARPRSLSAGSHSNNQRMTESVLQTKIAVAYGTHLMHTMHVLTNGKWDPISLLDDNDLWISSPSFIAATSHAVSAAEALNEILDYDPDLSFMPYFFGIYLLQSSFLLLLMADKLQGEASPSVVKACETIVRAHEACVVTLNTEYQRNFRKVMRSALAQVHGRMVEDFGEQQQRRREVLGLYRWTGDGTGLAL